MMAPDCIKMYTAHIGGNPIVVIRQSYNLIINGIPIQDSN